MTDLAAFLLARITDDIAAARYVQAESVTDGLDVDDPRSASLRLARRTLADCEAKRQLVSQFSDVKWASYAARDFVFETLALPYADHLDYRDEWRP